MGGDRRWAKLGRTWALVASVALAAAGCGIVGSVDNAGPPVPAGPLGPVLPAAGGGPPVECRGVPREICLSFGDVNEPNVVRVIVTCTGACTPVQGEVRIDLLRPNGTTESRGSGSYSGAGAPAPIPVAPVPEVTSQPEY